jgi:biopolymer transport protein ExbB/TolQ/biopolymer transport protein ExbD
MNGVCLNSWQPGGCEWSVGYLWRWMNGIVRLDVIVLALMLAGVAVVVTRISYRNLVARRVRQIDTTSRRKLAAVLSIELGSLKAIASSAPYLGLAGTCVGIMSGLGFGGIAMEKNAALALISSRIAVALVTTAAGILVAVPAICSYNYLCTRKDLLESEVSNDPTAQIRRYRQGARRLALAKRFSQLPAFALIAAPGLAVLVAVHTPYFAPREPTGLEVELGSTRCEHDGNDRLIVLHITDAGKLFLNTEQEDWGSLAGRLSKIYSVRAHQTLYLLADDAVPFQTVADALDTVENIPAVGPQAAGMEIDKLDITVRLLTPRASNTHCPQPVGTGSSQHVHRTPHDQ